jgi:PAS domain S-box-containing protein
MRDLVTYPRDDAVFARLVRERAATTTSAADLQRRLRRWHTRAVVREQDALAAFSPRTAWYAFRDGAMSPKSSEAWWETQGVACVAFNRAGTFIEANDAACALVDAATGSLVGRHWSELVPHDAAQDEGDWVWTELTTHGLVQSVFDFPTSDGGRKVIEYHSTASADPDRFESAWRETARISADDLPVLLR